MSSYHIKPIDETFNRAMLEILHGSPIVTDRMTICFDRQPDIFALSRCKYGNFFYHGLFHGDTLKGFGMVGYHTVLVNSKPSEVFCARDLYVLPEARGQGFVAKSTEMHFSENRHLSPVGYGVIMHGNKASMRLVGQRPESNQYSPLSRILNKLVINTTLLTLPVTISQDYIIRRAQHEDVPAIVKLLSSEHKDRLFGKIFTEEVFPGYLKKNTGLQMQDYFLAFDRNGQVCGVCAAWDMHGMKQTRVLKYGKAFLPAKIAWKSLAVLFSRPQLPEPGEHFREVTLTDYAVKGRDPKIMNALLRAIYCEYRSLGYHFMIWGSSADDPILTAAKGFLNQQIISNIVLFSTQGKLLEDGAVNSRLPYVDISAI
ncbi:MAG: hypothetical protein WCJ26_03930 [bacterium]